MKKYFQVVVIILNRFNIFFVYVVICDRFEFAFFFKNIKNNIKNKSIPTIFLLTSITYVMKCSMLPKHIHPTIPQNYCASALIFPHRKKKVNFSKVTLTPEKARMGSKIIRV